MVLGTKADLCTDRGVGSDDGIQSTEATALFWAVSSAFGTGSREPGGLPLIQKPFRVGLQA